MKCRLRALLPPPPADTPTRDHRRHQLATDPQTSPRALLPPPSLGEAAWPTVTDARTALPQTQVTLEQRVRELTAELAHAHTALQALRDQAELRGRALHHRVKNDLQVVVSLLDWHGQELQDPCARAVFEACQGRIRAIALVHTLLYRAGDGERLDLGQYLGRLARPLFEAYGVDRERIHLTLQADAVSVAADTAIPCGLLVHEVLVNCVQHAFPTPHRGVVTITLRVAPAGQATLTIRDTGIGWPGHGTVGAAEEFGLHLIRGLTEQLQGTLTFMREGGTGVTLRFPV
jgi:two-component sensor histidine kinase